MMDTVRVLIADDHPLFREDMGGLLDKVEDIAVVGEAADLRRGSGRRTVRGKRAHGLVRRRGSRKAPLVAQAVRKVSLETEQLAWLVLRAVNQTQTKGSTVRLAVPTDPEVDVQLPVAVTDEELLLAEEYLERHSYLAREDITLTRGTYTITPTGLNWLESGPPQRLEAAETIAESPEKSEPHSATGGIPEGARRPGWRRVFRS